MNILVWNSWVQHPVGGQERIALELARQLYFRGHTVVLVGPYDNAAELRAQIPKEMPFFHFDVHGRKPKPHGAVMRLLNGLVRRYGVQVISAHGSILAARLVCQWNRIPMVWTVHGCSSPALPLRRWMTRTFLTAVLASSRNVAVAVSQATANNLLQIWPRLPASRLRVIHNGIVQEESLQKLALPHLGPPWHLGFAGRLVARKRPSDLVALAHHLNGCLDFQMHVFGDGPLAGELRAAVAGTPFVQRFVFHGYWDKGADGIFEQIHILVNPDSFEPFGGAVLEAQLAGRPVVAYNVGGNPEIVESGQTGFLSTLGHTGELAEGILQLAGPGYSRFAAAARHRAEKLFPFSRMIDHYLQLMEELCVRN